MIPLAFPAVIAIRHRLGHDIAEHARFIRDLPGSARKTGGAMKVVTITINATEL